MVDFVDNADLMKGHQKGCIGAKISLFTRFTFFMQFLQAYLLYGTAAILKFAK